ncbi:MAG: DinB family protein [Acidobacteria bacterium]|nr:DinB family protein [Acidobacteriota bacterium]
MNLPELRTLLDYHYWARDRLLAAVERLPAEQFTRDVGNSFPSIRDTLVHLYGADRIWCARWEGETPHSMPDPAGFPDVAAIGRAWTGHERRMRALLDRLGEDGVAKSIEYRTMDGTPQAQVFWQMLQHLVNHGSYHRGQVTTMMRQLGQAPPTAMDLIAFYRERASGGMR